MDNRLKIATALRFEIEAAREITQYRSYNSELTLDEVSRLLVLFELIDRDAEALATLVLDDEEVA